MPKWAKITVGAAVVVGAAMLIASSGGVSAPLIASAAVKMAQGAAIGAVTSGAASVITQFAFERKVDAKQLAVDVGAGAVYGAIRFSPFGRITSTVLGFVTGGAQSIASDRAANKKSSPLVHLWNAAAGAVSTYHSWLPYRALSDPSFYSKQYKYPLDLTDPTRVNKVVFS